MSDIPLALQQRFVAGLPERWRSIAKATSSLACAQALHQLAGAAGSYGFDDLGLAARSAEQACGPQGAGWPTSEALDALYRCLVMAGMPADDTSL